MEIVGFVAQVRNGRIRCGHTPVLLALRFRELQWPARMPLLAGQLCGLVLSAFGDPAIPKIVFLSVGIALLGCCYECGIRYYPV